MKRPSPAQIEWAKQLLEHEGAAGGAAECAAAAGRVYDKIGAHLAPFVGVAGVHLLLVRSAKLSQGEFACLSEVANFGGSTKLRECLQALEPAFARESALALFGTFFALISTFIGERLTTQVRRSAWPAIVETSPRETRK
jgi:hypothetical protein